MVSLSHVLPHQHPFTLCSLDHTTFFDQLPRIDSLDPINLPYCSFSTYCTTLSLTHQYNAPLLPPLLLLRPHLLLHQHPLRPSLSSHHSRQLIPSSSFLLCWHFTTPSHHLFTPRYSVLPSAMADWDVELFTDSGLDRLSIIEEVGINWEVSLKRKVLDFDIMLLIRYCRVIGNPRYGPNRDWNSCASQQKQK